MSRSTIRQVLAETTTGGASGVREAHPANVTSQATNSARSIKLPSWNRTAPIPAMPLMALMGS
ncbi:hypothetical protein D3C76_1755460 [compost metagenome]